MRPHSLLAYNASGAVVATLDYLVARGPDGKATGLVDFAAIEEAGDEITPYWNVDGAVGAKVWPEWLGTAAHRFRVELVGPPGRKRIAALVHTNGHRRERAAVDAAIETRVKAAKGNPADIRNLVGGPGRPLALDENGATKARNP